MAQETSAGWGGAREGGGRKAGVPQGTGENKTVAVRIGTDLLEQLRQRWPHLKTDSDLIRAAAWEAIGQPKA